MRDSDRLLGHFRSEYGRLCVLVAKALQQGHGKTHVVEASRGEGTLIAPVYVELRKQRARANRGLIACKAAGVDGADIVGAARECRRAVEGEWMQRLPLFAETKED